MSKQTVYAPKGIKPMGPYTPAIRMGDLLFISGQVGIDPESGQFVEGGVGAQAKQVLENLKGLVEAGGSSMDKVLKTTMFLTNMADFAAVNEIYATYFASEPPARSTIQVAALPGGALVEIEAIVSVSGE
ncbi:MAG: Rid family detoxifying hydrolase [Anaerolineales bacterium]|jgi:reactive intermediate/imine deaminase|nr:Rid family detoxifying hydrolase [Anaerolineales bacterium]MCW5887735.1 Rid family detoxifying hydrolase [Anaerolineales bacterium]